MIYSMSIIEQIKAEIERRLKDYWKICFHDMKAYNEDSNVRELKELLSFLSTLESEKPIDELEEEISKSIENLEGCTTKVGEAPEYHLINDEDLREFARHFAKWGAEHLKQ